MRYLKRRNRYGKYDQPLEDPIAGVANLFDASVAFIVSMMIALFMVYNMVDFMDPKSEVTMTKKAADGTVEVITKKGREIKIQKVTDKTMSGEGKKLGTAYQLTDGRVVYVPDETTKKQ